MVSFRIFGREVVFEFGFFAVVALFCLIDAPELALTSVCACVIHELGHCFAGVLLGIRIRRVIFWTGGVRMIPESLLHPFLYDVIMLAMGPAFNIAAAVLFHACGMELAGGINLVLGLFNLMPFSNLDGGAVVRAMLERKGISPKGIMIACGVFTAMILGSFFYLSGTGNVTAYGTLAALVIMEFL